MKTIVWIAIYLPILVFLCFIIPTQQKNINMAINKKKKRGMMKLSNELIKNCIGKKCDIAIGTLGSSFYKVNIIEVVDNWIKVESKGKEDLINVDYIQSIKILPNKK